MVKEPRRFFRVLLVRESVETLTEGTLVAVMS